MACGRGDVNQASCVVGTISGWARGAFDRVYADDNLELVERTFVAMALVAFVVHLVIIWISRNAGYDLDWFSSSYLSALYTPFSFLLFYEVLMLVKALPESFSRSVAAQYEVVTLIVLRRVFKDIAHLDGTGGVELSNPVVWEVGADMVGALVLFVLVRSFRTALVRHPTAEHESSLGWFVAFKKGLALLLGVLVLVLATRALVEWGTEMYELAVGTREEMGNVNAVFYEDFFGILVLVDVLLLMISFALNRDTVQVFRNAGFIASTVVVRLSFTADRLESLVMLLFAVAFGLAVQLLSRWRSGDASETESRGADTDLKSVQAAQGS